MQDPVLYRGVGDHMFYIMYTYIFSRKWFPLQGELASLTKNVVFSY